MDETDLRRDLAEWIGGEDSYDPDAECPQHPGSDADAERLMWRYRHHRQEVAGVEKLAEDEIDRVRAWAADRTAGAKRQMAWLARSLEGWARSQVPEGQGRVLHLPSGTMRLTAPRESFVVDDPAALLAWCEQHCPEAVDRKVAAATVRHRGQVTVEPAVPTSLAIVAAATDIKASRVWDPQTEDWIPGVIATEPREASFTVKTND